MGGIRKFKRKRNKLSQKTEGVGQHKNGERGQYVNVIRKSEGFEKYYKAQNIVPESEWDCLLDSLKRDLPASFRISACNEKEATRLLDIVEGEFFKTLINPDEPEDQNKKPFNLPWYPKRLGWQVPLSRKDIRRSEIYFKLHNFLMSETESGNISRQEVVSMIPPLVLDVQPHHKVLDMCAAPGSKTAQLIEMMHSQGKLPDGVVVANDVDNSRCYMLVHQAKRLNSPCTLITNHDATVMPNIIINNPDGSPGILKYDRILCDVPCTGDGTMRKNPDIWRKWNCINANNLHGVQMRIVKRAGEMLSVGGRLVYSTCSMNPIENEAVMHRMIAESQGAVELEDISKSLPGLIYIPGLSSWVLASKEIDVFKTFDEVPQNLHSQIHPAMFPPKPDDVDKFHLDRCIRILPHHQDTGGFFVAVLKKVSLLPWESTKSLDTSSSGAAEIEAVKSNGPRTKRRRIMGYREDPFVFFKEDEQIWPMIREFYNISPEFQLECLLTRCHIGKKKNIYFVSPAVQEIINKNQDKIKLINAGVKVFSRHENRNSKSCFRLAQEGLQSIKSFVGDHRRVPVTKSDILTLLSNTDPQHPPETHTLDSRTQEKLLDFEPGSCVLEYKGEDGLNVDLVGWRGSCSLRAYVPLADAVHYIRLFGGDASIFDKNKFKKEDEIKEIANTDENTVKQDMQTETTGEQDMNDTDITSTAVDTTSQPGS